MAEAVGLVIGGVSLVALHDSAITCFGLVQLGRNFERDFAICHFHIEDARTRLCRRGKAVGVKDQDSAMRVLRAERFKQAGVAATTPRAGDNVSIQDETLEAAAREKLGHLYERDETFDKAKVKMGDRIFAGKDDSANARVDRPRNEYRENKTYGEARVHMGNEINAKGEHDDFWDN